MLVIDASSLVDALLVNALLVSGPARARLSAANLHAPELIDAQLLSVLRRLMLANKLLESQALQALTTASRLGLRRQPTRSLWPRAWELRRQPLGLRRPLRGAGRAAAVSPAHG